MAKNRILDVRVYKPVKGPKVAFADGSWRNPRAEGPLGKIRWDGLDPHTIAVHAGASRGGSDGDYVVTPAYTTTSVPTITCDELARRFANATVEGRKRRIYHRLGNRTAFELECALVGIHDCGDAMAFGSGMAAISHFAITLLAAGDNAVFHRTMYGCSDNLFSNIMPASGIETRFADLRNPRVLRTAIDTRTRFVFFETPANPTLDLIDISAVASEVNGRCPVAVDNTFASPIGQNPFERGANIVIYSMTKSIGGHGEAIGGAVLGSGTFIAHLFETRNDIGGILVSREAAAFLSGIKTLRTRYEAMERNARTIAETLRNHPAVETVYYPEFNSHYPLNGQMKGPGYMIAFVLKGGLEAGKRLVDGLKVITNAVSLGGVESLICHPASTTHAGVNPEERKRKGISDGLVRLSVGTESLGILYEDITQSLNQIHV